MTVHERNRAFFPNQPQGRDPADPRRYLGADDAHGTVLIPLADLHNRHGVIGIEIHKLSPDNGDMSGCLGFSPAWLADWKGALPGEYDADDIHVSLTLLCAEYGIPLDVVLDRLAVALLRLVPRAPASAAVRGGAILGLGETDLGALREARRLAEQLVGEAPFDAKGIVYVAATLDALAAWRAGGLEAVRFGAGASPRQGHR